MFLVQIVASKKENAFVSKNLKVLIELDRPEMKSDDEFEREMNSVFEERVQQAERSRQSCCLRKQGVLI